MQMPREAAQQYKKYICPTCFRRLHHTHDSNYENSPPNRYLDVCPIGVHEIATLGQKCESMGHDQSGGPGIEKI